MVNDVVCNVNVQLCGWRCLSGWLPWKWSARILQEETKEDSAYYRHNDPSETDGHFMREKRYYKNAQAYQEQGYWWTELLRV